MPRTASNPLKSCSKVAFPISKQVDDAIKNVFDINVDKLSVVESE